MKRVPPEGSIHSKIAIVGECPGETEEELGRPFVGVSGQLLDSILTEVGILRHDCYITNVVKYRPTNNNFDLFYNDPKRREPSPILLSAITELQAELATLSANVVVLMGGESLRAVLGKSGIFNWRGSVVFSNGRKYIPTLHTAYVLRQYPHRSLVVADFRRILTESRTRDCDLPKHTFLIRPTLDQALGWLSQPKSDRLAFDIETSENGSIRSLALSWDPGEAICIPFTRQSQQFQLVGLDLVEQSGDSNSYWSEEQEYEILRSLDRIFRDSSIRKVAHNYPFDAPLLEREFGLHCRGFYMDTLGVQHTCFAELPKDLGTCCSLYTRVPCYWDINSAVDEQLWLYNCYDAAVTLEISYALERQLERLGLTKFYFQHLNPALINVTRMMKRGIMVDEDFKIKNREENLVEMNRAEVVAKQITGNPNFNARSSQQVQALLYKQLGMEVQYDRKTKQPTASKDAIARLRRMYPQHDVLLEPLHQYRSLANLHDRFLGVPTPPDKCFRTHLNIFGTVNGRAASSDPLFEVGTNLQNIKRGHCSDPTSSTFRKMFRARPGKLFIKADYSQAELRFVVWKARILKLVEAYRKDPNYDTYRWIASQIYQKAEDQISKPERWAAKQGTLASLYGTLPPTFAATCKIPLSTARFVLERIHLVLPEIQLWWRTCEERIQRNRTIENSFGRKRIFWDRIGPSLYRDSYNAEPQGFVADLCWTAINQIESAWDGTDAQLLLQVHDELLAEVPEQEVMQRAKEQKEMMEISVEIWKDLPPLLIPVEVGVGPNWYDTPTVKL